MNVDIYLINLHRIKKANQRVFECVVQIPWLARTVASPSEIRKTGNPTAMIKDRIVQSDAPGLPTPAPLWTEKNDFDAPFRLDPGLITSTFDHSQARRSKYHSGADFLIIP